MARAPKVSSPARRSRAPAAPAPTDNRNARVELFYMDVHEIVPYQRNPRDNAEAVASVAASIKEFGFRIPIVVDNDNVIVCGHTRVEAAKSLGLSEIPATRADGLSQKQIDAFRLIDNKVSELARWDFDLLAGEIQALSDSGINMTEFGWTREELDCLSTTVANDCLSVEGLISSEDRERAGITERRAPSTARFVLGELVFFIPAADYRRWVDGIRTMHDYNESAIIAELKNRLGVIEDAVEATQRVRRVRGAGAPNSH